MTYENDWKYKELLSITYEQVFLSAYLCVYISASFTNHKEVKVRCIFIRSHNQSGAKGWTSGQRVELRKKRKHFCHWMRISYRLVESRIVYENVTGFSCPFATNPTLCVTLHKVEIFAQSGAEMESSAWLYARLTWSSKNNRSHYYINHYPSMKPINYEVRSRSSKGENI